MRTGLAAFFLIGAATFGATLLAPGAIAQDAAVCLSNGISYQVGEVACIPGCHGAQRLARCDAADKSGSWTTIATQCPTARATPIPPGSPFRPVVLACNMMNHAPFAQFQGDRGLIQ